jgi:hypothetical protein
MKKNLKGQAQQTGGGEADRGGGSDSTKGAGGTERGGGSDSAKGAEPGTTDRTKGGKKTTNSETTR